VVVVLLAAALGQRPTAPVSEDVLRHQRMLAIEDARDPTPSDLQWLTAVARGSDGGIPVVAETRVLAVRTLGRLERRDLIPLLTVMLPDPAVGRHAAAALMITLRADPAVPGDEEGERTIDIVLGSSESPAILGHLPYRRSDQVLTAETKLRALGQDPTLYPAVAAGFEALARKHRRLHAIGDGSREFLTKAVHRSLPAILPDDHFTPRAALAALAAAGLADEAIIRAGLRDRNDQVRRTAMVALNAVGAGVEASVRVDLIRDAFDDASFFVRYEAVRGWSRHAAAARGCEPLTGAMADPNVHVVLAAIDALGERCRADDEVTTRVAAEVRIPPTIGSWHREAHALVALAKRSPDRAATLLPGFMTHTVWQVRMYAARAAAAMKDEASLERLAFDPHENVREATLGPLRTLKQSESDAAFIAALAERDYQLRRTAALELKAAGPTKYLLTALVDALTRVSAEETDTSRDTRLALLAQIRAWGGREQLPLYQRMTKDFDPQVAAAAADACSALAATACAASPARQKRPAVPNPGELSERLKAVVELDTGRKFEMVFQRDVAPLAYARFVRLVRRHYYDGLTFHRVVPNYVIQGGSPGANEYMGDGPYMRDEFGGAHRRGTVGISTRGHHTGDAQIFVNLVDNPTLDFDYTVFATASPMEIVDEVQEGTRIRRIQLVPYSR
jgi:cyclophilin family peptidyl-prolyl cis-trans isomerase